jgi:hypothetical protein
MMSGWRNEIGSYVIITAVAVLVWIWAANETREQETVISKVQFVVPDDGAWIIEPDNFAVSMVVEGSRLAIQNVEALARSGFIVELAPEVGVQIVDVESKLIANQALRETGSVLRSIDRPSATPSVDRLVPVQLTVLPSLPGVQFETQPRIDPPTATLSLPSRLQSQYSDIRVQAFAGQDQTASLPEGVQRTLDVPLRILPDALAANEHVTVVPSRVRLSFTIRSQTRELKLNQPVKVQLAGPFEDQKDFYVEFETDTLRDVTVSADADLVRRIESGEATVVAVVYLRSIEKERIAAGGTGSAEVPVSYFMAMIGSEGRPVRVRINGADQAPLIKLKVTGRPRQNPAQ